MIHTPAVSYVFNVYIIAYMKMISNLNNSKSTVIIKDLEPLIDYINLKVSASHTFIDSSLLQLTIFFPSGLY